MDLGPKLGSFWPILVIIYGSSEAKLRTLDLSGLLWENQGELVLRPTQGLESLQTPKMA